MLRRFSLQQQIQFSVEFLFSFGALTQFRFQAPTLFFSNSPARFSFFKVLGLLSLDFTKLRDILLKVLNFLAALLCCVFSGTAHSFQLRCVLLLFRRLLLEATLLQANVFIEGSLTRFRVRLLAGFLFSLKPNSFFSQP